MAYHFHPIMTCRFAFHPSYTTALLITASLSLGGAVRAAESYEAFLEKHCIACHGPDKEKGDLRIDQLSRDFKLGADTHHWAEVIERVNSGEMPPKKEKRPSQQEIAEFITTLDSRLKEGKAARMAARPAVAHYRLSRKEYQNTVYDLLGVRYDPTKPGELNEDTLWHGFERIGSELSLSPSHVDRYYRAAGTVLDRAFSGAGGRARIKRMTASELLFGPPESQRAKEVQESLELFGIRRPLRQTLFATSETGYFAPALSSFWLRDTQAQPGRIDPPSGLYRVRIQASGIRPKDGQLAHLRIGTMDPASRIIGGLIEFDITAPEDHPQVHDFEVFVEMPTTLHFQVVSSEEVPKFANQFGGRTYLFTHSSDPLLLNPTAAQLFDDKGNALFPTVLLDWIEWEGPLLSEAEKSRRAGVLPPDGSTPEVVAEHLQRFAARAWRRPVKAEELAGYLQAYRSELDAGETAAVAYQVALRGVLTAKDFLYLVEGDPVARERINDWELASRLSYFLWSSMPDEGLMAAAKAGSLGGSLSKEVDRMLADGKAGRFIDDFARQWLQLHRLGMFPPDRKIYPGYDRWLEKSMGLEPVEYFREVFAKNLPIDAFIDSDWTMANARLCDFYGLQEPKSDGFQRISLKPEDHRGGLLAMGAVLGLTSDGTRHRPVHRGVWLYEAILGKTPPPPPANVPPIEPTPPGSPKATLRQKLEAHRLDANCAACHAKIDPLGLAWDNYNAIGEWRTHEKSSLGVGKDPLVDPSGTLPDGRAFKDPNELKKLLLEDRDKFGRAFIEHLCTYALRRVLTFDDQAGLDAIQAEARKGNYRVRDMIRAVALSDLIRMR
jgi:mono/diheme cytochrome c family protein